MAKTSRPAAPAHHEKRTSLRQLPPDPTGPLRPRENIRLINEEYARGTRQIRDAAGNLRDGLDHYVRAGQRLMIERERVRHGDWMLFVESSFPDMSLHVVERLIRLAKSAHVQTTRPAMQTLRQALLAAGIIKPALPNGQFRSALAPVPGQDAFQIEMVALYFHRWETAVFRAQLPIANRAQLEYWRDYLDPVAKLLAEVQPRLSEL